MAQAADQVAVLILRPIPSAYGPDGARPWATLVRDTAGNLFGTTSEGGTFDSGTVFKLDPKGNETVLHNFTGGADGWFPAEGELALDAAGSIYGAASGGGSGRFGAVFKLDGTGTETVLHNFTGGLDGEGPHGSVVLDALVISTARRSPVEIYVATHSAAELFSNWIWQGTKPFCIRFMEARTGAGPVGNLLLDKSGNL